MQQYQTSEEVWGQLQAALLQVGDRTMDFYEQRNMNVLLNKYEELRWREKNATVMQD